MTLSREQDNKVTEFKSPLQPQRYWSTEGSGNLVLKQSLLQFVRIKRIM